MDSNGARSYSLDVGPPLLLQPLVTSSEDPLVAIIWRHS